MNPLAQWIFCWPRMPPRPPVRQPVLVRLTVSAPRPLARTEVRAVLREVIASWSGRPADSVALRETPHGPVLDGEVGGDTFHVSIAYNDREAWIGLRCGGAIGLDVTPVKPIREMEAVAQLYLGPSAWGMILQSPDPHRAFAQAWTALEARLKCRKKPLTEWPDNENGLAAPPLMTYHHLDDQRAVAVAVD